MTLLTWTDWLRLLICLMLFRGAWYLIFPKSIQDYSILIVDAPIRNLRLFGAFLIIMGFLTWYVLSVFFSAPLSVHPSV